MRRIPSCAFAKRQWHRYQLATYSFHSSSAISASFSPLWIILYGVTASLICFSNYSKKNKNAISMMLLFLPSYVLNSIVIAQNHKIGHWLDNMLFKSCRKKEKMKKIFFCKIQKFIFSKRRKTSFWNLQGLLRSVWGVI